MKHINFTKPIRLINPSIKKLTTKPPHERILFTKKITWSKDPKTPHDSQTKQRLQK